MYPPHTLPTTQVFTENIINTLSKDVMSPLELPDMLSFMMIPPSRSSLFAIEGGLEEVDKNDKDPEKEKDEVGELPDNQRLSTPPRTVSQLSTLRTLNHTNITSPKDTSPRRNADVNTQRY
jgi:hypothetical protein